MSKNLKNVEKLLKGKEIIITNTKKDKFAFELAHVLRDFAKKTYCMDETYNIKENKDGIRKIEDGKVFLINSEFSYNGVQNTIRKKLKGKPKYMIIITELK